jgi:dienelactone hydrolase
MSWTGVSCLASITCVAALLLAETALSQFTDWRTNSGPYAVESSLGQWEDSERDNRVVKWRAYLPRVDRKVPVVIFSHGSGGSRDGNAMLGEHLASHGFAALHLQHEGSDIDAFRSDPRATRGMIKDPRLSAPRFKDIRFVVSRLSAPTPEEPFIIRIDCMRIGMSGHSFGGLTTQVIAGQHVPGFDRQLAIPELKGAFVLSPSPPRAAYGDANSVFDSMRMPMFFMTGTDDAGPEDGFKADERRVPFDKSTGIDRWLAVLNTGNHFTFSGLDKVPRLIKFQTGIKDDPNVASNHALIRGAAISFWKWILLDDTTELQYLTNGGFASLVGKNGTFEFKPAS